MLGVELVINLEKVSFRQNHSLKSRFSEKSTKVGKNLTLVLTLLSENSCFVKKDGIFFFQIVRPSHNVLTLKIMQSEIPLGTS